MKQPDRQSHCQTLPTLRLSNHLSKYDHTQAFQKMRKERECEQTQLFQYRSGTPLNWSSTMSLSCIFFYWVCHLKLAVDILLNVAGSIRSIHIHLHYFENCGAGALVATCLK